MSYLTLSPLKARGLIFMFELNKSWIEASVFKPLHPTNKVNSEQLAVDQRIGNNESCFIKIKIAVDRLLGVTQNKFAQRFFVQKNIFFWNDCFRQFSDLTEQLVNVHLTVFFNKVRKLNRNQHAGAKDLLFGDKKRRFLVFSCYQVFLFFLLALPGYSRSCCWCMRVKNDTLGALVNQTGGLIRFLSHGMRFL